MAVLNHSVSSTNFTSKEILNFIDVYFSKVTKKLPFQKSSSGSTGVTFLPLDYSFVWVVKWQNSSQSEIEYLCTQFYQRSFTHLSVPQTIYDVGEPLIKKIRKYFSSTTIAPDHVPILMEYKNGNNLNKFYENKNIFKLSNEELEKLFSDLGEVSGYDFLIANCDRFIPTEFRGALSDAHAANGGNILVELKVPDSFESSDASARLKRVHLIDNAPHFLSFFDSDERKMEGSSKETDFSFDGFGGFFGGDSNEPKKVSMESSIAKDRVTGQQIRGKRHEDFEYFIKAESEKVDLLATQLSMGIKREWKRTYPDKNVEIDGFFADNEKAIHLGLNQGLLKAQKNIKEPKLQSVLKELKVEAAHFSQNAQTVISFIEKNLKFAQN